MNPSFKLTDEQIEIIRTLQDSVAFKLYMKVLKSAKEGYFHSILPSNDPNFVLKQSGIVTGINFSVNLVDNIVLQKDTKDAKLKKSGDNPE